jgi:hypothetical protein
MVRDKFGNKMSKSRGNVIDPLEVINGCSLQDLLHKIDEGNLPLKEVFFNYYYFLLLLLFVIIIIFTFFVFYVMIFICYYRFYYL